MYNIYNVCVFFPVNLRGINDEFKGFILQVRSKNTSSIRKYGSFMNSSTHKYVLMNCDERADSISHSNSEYKSEVAIDWTAPDTDVGDLRFVYVFESQL